VRPTERELLVGVADALAALAAELGRSELRVQLEMAAAIVRRVGSGLGQARSIIVADSHDMAATLASLGPLAASADVASLVDVAGQAATALPDGWADGSDDDLEAIHERLQSLVVEAQRAAVAEGGSADAAIRALHRRSLERRAVVDHPFVRP
jgi:hypothetical protein